MNNYLESFRSFRIFNVSIYKLTTLIVTITLIVTVPYYTAVILSHISGFQLPTTIHNPIEMIWLQGIILLAASTGIITLSALTLRWLMSNDAETNISKEETQPAKLYIEIMPILVPQENPQTKPQYSGIVEHGSGFDPYLNEEEFENAWKKIGGTPYHLHITSERKIKAGDYMTDGTKVYHNEVELDGYIGLYKIEASTDKTLGLPATPKLFTQAYLALSGKGLPLMKPLTIQFDSANDRVVSNENGEVIFVINPTDATDLAEAIKFSENCTTDTGNPVVTFTTRLAVQGAFLAGAEFKAKQQK